MTGGTYKLYGRLGAGSLAPQILLEEIGVPYELVWVSRAPAEIEALRRISPAGKVPVLVLADGTAMSESAAILIHLTIAHPAADLAPRAGTTAHARFLQRMVFLSANVYEAALRFFYAERYCAAGTVAAADIKARARADWARHLELIHDGLSPYYPTSRNTLNCCVAGRQRARRNEITMRVSGLRPPHRCDGIQAAHRWICSSVNPVSLI